MGNDKTRTGNWKYYDHPVHRLFSSLIPQPSSFHFIPVNRSPKEEFNENSTH